MRVLLISALVASLIGCTCLAPPPAALKSCPGTTGDACSDLAGYQSDVKWMALKVPAPKPNSSVGANQQDAPPVRFGKKSRLNAKTVKYSTAGTMRPPPSAQLHDKPDLVMERAKAAIAAMMENPASAEFWEMKRGVRNLLGESIDMICGFVKGKNAAGEDTGEMPVLYIVQRNEAYIVDGSSTMAATAYRNLCN